MLRSFRLIISWPVHSGDSCRAFLRIKVARVVDAYVLGFLAGRILLYTFSRSTIFHLHPVSAVQFNSIPSMTPCSHRENNHRVHPNHLNRERTVTRKRPRVRLTNAADDADPGHA